jgi:hypothetical protein
MKPWLELPKENQSCTSRVIFYDDPAWVKILEKMHEQQLSSFKRKSMLGQDVTYNWFFEETQNLSLFSEKNLWNVFQAEKIPAKHLAAMVSSPVNIKNLSDTLFWFWLPLGTKNNSWKQISCETLSIDKVAFWEETQCVQWIMKLWNVFTKELISLWPLDQELTLSQHVQLVEMLSKGLLKNNDVKKYFEQTSFDKMKFVLLEHFEKKAMAQFFKCLKEQLEMSSSLEKLRLIQFIRSHVFKLVKFKDDDSLNAKSSFEKRIQNSSKNWPKKDLLKYLKLFLDWEIQLKANQDIQFDLGAEYSLILS